MFLPGVGPKKKEILSKELGINSYSDLLEYYPYKYVDRSKVFHISELNAVAILSASIWNTCRIPSSSARLCAMM